ncbi:NfeD family protein [Acidithiobacillus sp. IBUN Pt1247-S3]|uniref:NfeD family protein n=1 Tax=Acidithiobacillus sp. IBUN Pt1247-S3 TaxID=3166642 RepID=UPI0034E48FF7
MLLLYLIIAVIAGLAELFTGTFYLAAVALAALITLIAGFVLPQLTLHWVFLASSIILILASTWLRHRLARKASGVDDLDLGQAVEILRGPDAQGRYRVRYRGSEWPAVLEEDDSACAGASAVIVAHEGNLLHIALLPPSSRESLCPPPSSASSSS